MNLKEQLVDSSKLIGDIVARNVGNDPKLYSEIVNLVIKAPLPMSSRAGRVLNLCTEKYPDLFVPFIESVIGKLKSGKQVHRCILKIFAEMNYSLTEKQKGVLIDACFRFLSDHSLSIAVKIYSMTILEKFTHELPDLIPELKGILKEIIPVSSVGVKNRAGKIIMKIENRLSKV